MKKIAVIIPCYNAEQYISRCLDSILNQIYRDFEIVVIDDGSTDNTLNIVELYLRKNNCIKVIKKSNEGVSSARNMGINQVEGEFLTFVDADDYVEPNFLEELIKVAENREIPFGNFNRLIDNQRIGEDNRIIGEYSTKQVVDYLMSGKLYGCVWRCLFVTSIIREKNIYFEKIHFCEDILFLVRYLMNANFRCRILKSTIYNYNCQNFNSVSKNQYSRKYLNGYIDLPNQFAKIFKESNKISFYYQRKVNKEYAISVLRIYRSTPYREFIKIINSNSYRHNASLLAIPKGDLRFVIVYYLFYFKLYPLLTVIGKK